MSYVQANTQNPLQTAAFRIPWMLVSHGGVPTILAMLVAIALVGLPTFFMEMSMARLAGVGPTKLFGQMVPALKILGLVLVLASLITMSNYAMILLWAMQLFVQSFQLPLPWANTTNTTYCSDNSSW